MKKNCRNCSIFTEVYKNSFSSSQDPGRRRKIKGVKKVDIRGYLNGNVISEAVKQESLDAVEIYYVLSYRDCNKWYSLGIADGENSGIQEEDRIG